MPYDFEPMHQEHGPAVLAVLNHHIAGGFAAYPSHPLPPQAWEMFNRARADYPAYVVKRGEMVVGFGLLRPYLMPDTLARTAEVSYFFLPQHAGQGLGSRLLEMLVAEARERGVDNLLANVSSLNEGSLRFHRRHGFVQVGRFPKVGRKWDQDFDLVWLQKVL
ncbi:MAG: GNAT family N-acetyltransferase [Proteobacteria bacterium]|nr:GNAT family N-acetyltransferase [Pseudomonadota bacterium]MBU2467841.1 GNAT family N-acetyltransferase [Pseudomonadota bacterium]